MRVSITFSDDKPMMSIGSLEGTILNLWGMTEHIVSKDPTNDTLSTWFRFFILQEGNSWNFDYQSNCGYSRDEHRRIIDDLLAKANRAIVEKKVTVLSREFNALDVMEPYSFGGLYSRMNEYYGPILETHDYNRALSEMRARLRSSLSSDEIESDKHLKSFVLQTPLETMWVDDRTCT